MKRTLTILIAPLLLLGLAGCAPDAERQSDAEPATASASSGVATPLAAAELPGVSVFKNAACGCCNGWVDHMREAGFDVEAHDVGNLTEVKVASGVPGHMASCHTAHIDGYTIEGHVPADVIQRLLAERPDIEGLAVPGMPIGSPGMEGPNPQPYEVFAFDADGNTTVFAEVDPR